MKIRTMSSGKLLMMIVSNSFGGGGAEGSPENVKLMFHFKTFLFTRMVVDSGYLCSIPHTRNGLFHNVRAYPIPTTKQMFQPANS